MKRTYLAKLTVFALSIAALLFSPGKAAAQFEYAAKFICLTNIGGTSSATSTVLPGAYRTVINIHNPGRDTEIRKKIAVTFPESKISEFSGDGLRSDQAIEIDCDLITRKFGIRFIHGAEGFLVIISPVSLDVTAVYTAGSRASDNAVQSIAVEHVAERQVGH